MSKGFDACVCMNLKVVFIKARKHNPIADIAGNGDLKR